LLLYYITDRTQFPGPEWSRRQQLVERVGEAAGQEIDYLQVREKDLPARELEPLAREIVSQLRKRGARTRVLINSRTDIALAAGADGVHLRANDVSPEDVRRIWSAAGAASPPVIAVSCHREQEVQAAKIAGADFVVFGPVFAKSDAPGVGLSALGAACGHGIPVLALGGISVENAPACMQAGARGIAGIRLFQQGALKTAIAKLRGKQPPHPEHPASEEETPL
jgi:thiamine-phosphate pyrophosphorylase